MGATYDGTIEIDEDCDPKTIDLLFTGGPERGRRNLGIYALGRNRWTLCLDTRGRRRPTRFATQGAGGVALQVLTRGSDDRRRRSRAGTSKSVPRPRKSASHPATVLDGEWLMVSAVLDGMPLDAAMVQWCRRVTEGDITTVLAGPQVMLQATFTTGLAQDPRQIDYLNLAGSTKGKSQAGIFTLERGILTICMAPPGARRPHEFVSRRGDGRSYSVWRRK
jgi:uncharacterized protein (TIGR03067 family)